MKFIKKNFLLLPIFLLGIYLRFLFFPDNTYFGFDQARDAFAVGEILQGDFKITGPPTANGEFRHGVLYYYIFAPFYLFSGGDPATVSAFLRVLNAAGIFLLFPLVLVLFGEAAAIIAAFLFAVSFEQAQFALFLNHPSLAVISVLVFYLGLAYWIFRKKVWGLYGALFGLGLSIQFEFVEIQLVAVFILFVLIFRKNLPRISLKYLAFAIFSFLLPLSSYLIAELKNNFIIVRQIPKVIFGDYTTLYPALDALKFLFFINRHITDNFSGNPIGAIMIGSALLMALVILIIKNIQRRQIIFLMLWFFGGLLVYFVTSDTAYFYNTGTSISLLIFVAFLLAKLYSKNRVVVISILFLILLSNLYLITKNNPLGPNTKINPQIGLLLKDEEKVIDFIYQQATGEEFAVNALTMPYNVNTTWSYLFEWYGKGKYGYLPVWGGNSAAGFPGNLRVETARSKLPAKRFLIIEPQEGIPSYMAKEFLSGEENYATVTGEKRIGTLKVLMQQPK